MRFTLRFFGLGACLLASATPSIAEEQTPASVEANNAQIAAVQAHVDAYRSGNLDRFVATFAKDAKVHTDGMTAIGHTQIKALYALNFKSGAPDLRIYDNGMDGDVIWMSAGYVFANGEEMCCSISEYKVRGGKISFLRSTMQ